MKKDQTEYKGAIASLSEAQLLRFALVYRKFKKGLISYKEMIKVLEEDGIKIVRPNLKPSNRFKLLREAEAFQERVNTGEYLPSDLISLYYQIPGSNGVASLCYDRDILELLASHGDEEAIQTLENIEKFQHKHVPTYQPKSYRR